MEFYYLILNLEIFICNGSKKRRLQPKNTRQKSKSSGINSVFFVTKEEILRFNIMKFIIQKEDIKDLVGKFIVQLNNEDANKDFTKNESNSDFMLSKRIHFVATTGENKILLAGLFYSNRPKSIEDFVEYFNQKGKDRFHRLLTANELRWLMGKMIERNF